MGYANGNPVYLETLRSGPLRIVGSDAEGVARAVELADHPFFVGTLFLPRHTSTPSDPHPLITGFLRACSPGPGNSRHILAPGDNNG